MKTFDVYGIGNALVDCEYSVTDEFLNRHGIIKNAMTLVDEDRMNELLDSVENLEQKLTSGGSVANTVYAASALGCKAFFNGSVQNDLAGRFFVDDLTRANIAMQRTRASSRSMTGRCLVFVTEDGERSMNTHLAISEHLNPTMVDESAINNSSWLYMEGYLASSPTGCAAAAHARKLAKRHGSRTSITLSAPSIIENFRDELKFMIGDRIDLVFCNIHEAYAWALTDRLDVAIKVLHESAGTVVVTDSENGCFVSTSEAVIPVPSYRVRQIDANGAGDVFAGAFLAALMRNENLIDCARFANFLGSRAVLTYGARLPTFESYAEHEIVFRRDWA